MLPKRTHFLKDDRVLEKFKTILEDKSFSISKYGIKPSYILEKLEKKSKIQYSSAKKIKNIYNDYFKTDFQIEDLFNTKMIITYIIEYKINFFYTPSENDEILREGIKLIMNSTKYGNNDKDDFDKKIKIFNIPKIIFYLLLTALFTLFLYYVIKSVNLIILG